MTQIFTARERRFRSPCSRRTHAASCSARRCAWTDTRRCSSASETGGEAHLQADERPLQARRTATPMRARSCATAVTWPSARARRWRCSLKGERVDVTGVTKGKGFSGQHKRHNFSRGPVSHGSHNIQQAGSIGSTDAARVFKGLKMAGHLGASRSTVRDLEVVRVDAERNLLLVKGRARAAGTGRDGARPRRPTASRGPGMSQRCASSIRRVRRPAAWSLPEDLRRPSPMSR